ncbi:MAG: group II intron reverse transcriptase domain-containing protein [Pirellulaceae bacterium]|nr:group II intron reverse transcriptase domain-containing protein [Pirellulaceae bacterium]
MKRYGNLWPTLTSFEHLLKSSEKAKRGKRFRPAVARYEFNLERELFALQDALQRRVYRPGDYRSFYIYEPKKRLISAAPYRDRIVHHALTGMLEPVFEPTFISDSYACRKGKGTHAAVDRCQQFARRFRYVYKADIRKFFPSMDHDILKQQIARKIKDADVLWLVGRIIDGSNPQEDVRHYFPGDDLFTHSERRRGIPIGNQTSQFYANVYLDPLDHFVKERLRFKGYVRYVDDFLLFSDDKRQLAEARCQIADFLHKLRLQLHCRKNTIFPVQEGIRFLGYRVFPTHRLLVKENVWRFLRRVRCMQKGYSEGNTTLLEIRQRLMSWSGHARQADTHRLRTYLFDIIKFQRVTAE